MSTVGLTDSHAGHSARFHIGSCAWKFADWRGSFYPQGLPAMRWLAWYAREFNAVEIDSTYHAGPSPRKVARWLESAPSRFRFACKAPRIVMQQLQLRESGAALADFMEAMQPLRSHLGPILFQLPRTLTPERDAGALREFVTRLPHGWKFVIEFPCCSWHLPRFVRLLQDHNVCWAWTDTSPLAEQARAPFDFLPETADFLYLRLMGDPATKYDAKGKPTHRYDRLAWRREAALNSWGARLTKHANTAKDIYVMAGNHYEGFAPETCRRIAERLGIEAALPASALQGTEAAKGPRQMTLF